MALNLADALDQLQEFLPAGRSISIASYQHGYLKGMLSVSISTGEGHTAEQEIRGSHIGRNFKLSEGLFAAEADHAAKWNAKHGAAEIADAEFGRFFLQVAA